MTSTFTDNDIIRLSLLLKIFSIFFVKKTKSKIYRMSTNRFIVSYVRGIQFHKNSNCNSLDRNANQCGEKPIADSIGDKELSILQVIDESSLEAMMQEILHLNKTIFQALIEEINAQFLKLRLTVSREMCRIEQNNNRRWQEFNATLLKLAGCDELEKEVGSGLSEAGMNGDQNVIENKDESLFYPTKHKLIN